MLVILSGCVKTTNSLKGSDLPKLPMPNNQALDEIEFLCDENNCVNFNTWLNELYLFKVEYNHYREEK